VLILFINNRMVDSSELKKGNPIRYELFTPELRGNPGATGVSDRGWSPCLSNSDRPGLRALPPEGERASAPPSHTDPETDISLSETDISQSKTVISQFGPPCKMYIIWGVQCIYTAYLTGRGGAVRRQGGHAFVYLRLDMPAAHVDVNVHPTKREVTPSSETGSPLNCHCDSGVNSRYSRGAPYQNARWAMYHYQRLQYCLCTPELQRQPRGECL
jgi:hypothetical protein